MEIQAFTQLLPDEQLVPLIVNSPHSGSYYPETFLASSRLGNLAIRKSEDFEVDELVKSATEFGIPVLSATYPRAYVDVNREPYELDPDMFEGPLPGFVNRRSIRVSGGLGTIPRIVAEGEEIYAGRIPVETAMGRIAKIYRPYHEVLQTMLAKTHVRFGVAILLDFHSMPSSGITGHANGKPDIVLGDRFSGSCSPQLVHLARTAFAELGYKVSVNRPYAGGFITEHYGRPENGLHALQIEINRALYMDEVRISRNDRFESLQADLGKFFASFTKIDFSGLQGNQPLAAE